jgi:hypothetical protein
MKKSIQFLVFGGLLAVAVLLPLCTVAPAYAADIVWIRTNIQTLEDDLNTAITENHDREAQKIFSLYLDAVKEYSKIPYYREECRMSFRATVEKAAENGALSLVAQAADYAYLQNSQLPETMQDDYFEILDAPIFYALAGDLKQSAIILSGNKTIGSTATFLEKGLHENTNTAQELRILAYKQIFQKISKNDDAADFTKQAMRHLLEYKGFDQRIGTQPNEAEKGKKIYKTTTLLLYAYIHISNILLQLDEVENSKKLLDYILSVTKNATPHDFRNVIYMGPNQFMNPGYTIIVGKPEYNRFYIALANLQLKFKDPKAVREWIDNINPPANIALETDPETNTIQAVDKKI